MSGNIVAMDPGTDKLGMAVLSETREILYRSVVERLRLAEVFREIVAEYRPKVVVLGNGTGAESFVDELNRKELLPSGCRIVLVEEFKTSEEARKLYLFDHRQGWRKFVPLGLQTPAEPYDDYVAVILGERYIDSLAQN